MTEHVKIAVADGVMVVTLNRPEKKNALTNEMYGALVAAFTRARDDAAVRVLLIEGEGGAYTAGNDLGDFARVAAGTLKREDMHVGPFLPLIASFPKPIVAAVEGVAVGIGTTMLLHCDLVFVAADARLSTPFVDLALVPEAASSLLLPARVGYARAFAMFALGEVVEGTRAAEIGLANRALPAGEVRPAALEAARILARKASGAVLATKQLLRHPEALVEQIRIEREVFDQRLRSPEAAEAFRAFAEKRKPDFTKLG